MDLVKIATRIFVGSSIKKYWKATKSDDPNVIPGYLTRDIPMLWVYVESFADNEDDIIYVMEYNIDIDRLSQVDDEMDYDSWSLKDKYGDLDYGFYCTKTTFEHPLDVIIMNSPILGKMVGAYKAGKMWDGTSAAESDQDNGVFSVSDLNG